MKPRITPAIRALAADICAVRASTPDLLAAVDVSQTLTGKVSPLAVDLAIDAYWQTWMETARTPACCHHAEAEARLRTGFVPEGWR